MMVVQYLVFKDCSVVGGACEQHDHTSADTSEVLAAQVRHPRTTDVRTASARLHDRGDTHFTRTRTHQPGGDIDKVGWSFQGRNK